jgi:RHS repeat-associated protein
VIDFIYDREGHVMLRNSNPASPSSALIEMYVAGLHLGTYVLNSTATDTIFYYNHADWLGTERARTNPSGAVCETIQSLPFGDGQGINSTCEDVSPMHFTGKERDAESGLDNFGARYNASSMGRFMTPDPLYIEEQKMLDPQQLNLYSYVRNNPLSLTDPTGMLVDLNCQQVSSEQCAQTVSDFNNRQGNQFQVTRDEQTGQLNVSVQTEITDPGEKALYNAITNKDATGTLTVTPNDSSFDFETSTGKGANSLDRSDLNALGAADKHAPGDVISHAAIESYESAKPGVSVDQAHDIAGTYFGFSHGAFTPNWGTTVTGFGVKWRFYHVNENLLEQAKLKTPIPRATWNNLVLQGGSMTLPRDVTSVGVLP